VLVNNAGGINPERSLTVDGFETTFAVNHLAYFLLTKLLLERIRTSAPARIVNVSSEAHRGARIDFDNLQGERGYGFAGARAYGQSKLANVLFTYELARRREGSRVTVNCLHPGVVATGFGHNSGGLMGRLLAGAVTAIRPFVLNAERGAETSVYLASSAEVEGVTGKYFEKKQAVASSIASYDESVATQLWQVSEKLTELPGSAT